MMTALTKRPALDAKISLKDFKEFYWLKIELVNFCKQEQISSAGGKLELAKRIVLFLETGIRSSDSKAKRAKSISKFDWNNNVLTLETKITDNYKSTENVRNFLTNIIGKHFKFNVLFMNWMKVNTGKTLKDAVQEWNRIYLLKKDEDYESEIDVQFEYNTYMRDFLKDNPTLSAKDARAYWMLKRETRGSKKYTASDLLLK